jgi:PAS domain-containing protein
VNECNACGCPSLVDTPQERNRHLALITDVNLKEAVDDWDFLWLYDRESHITYWNPRLEP